MRELENLIQRLVITVRGEEIRASHLPSSMLALSVEAQEKILLPEGGADFDEEIQRFEIALLTTALNRSNGSKAAAARLLRLDGQRIKSLPEILLIKTSACPKAVSFSPYRGIFFT